MKLQARIINTLYCVAISIASPAMGADFQSEVFSISHPDEWKIVETEFESTVVKLLINHDDGANCRANMLLDPELEKKTPTQVMQIIQSFNIKEYMKRILPTIRVQKSGNINIGGVPAQYAYYELPWEIADVRWVMKGIQVQTANGGAVITLNCDTLDATFESYHDAFISWLLSLRFNP